MLTIEAAFAAIANMHPDAVLVPADALMFQNRATLVCHLAAHYMLPATYPIREFVKDGGLMSYGTNYSKPTVR